MYTTQVANDSSTVINQYHKASSQSQYIAELFTCTIVIKIARLRFIDTHLRLTKTRNLLAPKIYVLLWQWLTQQVTRGHFSTKNCCFAVSNA